MSQRDHAQQQAHDQAQAAGHEGYFDPQTGLFVMTRAYLLARGNCCSTGCRHCPYDELTQQDSSNDA